jgi:putative aldouronate transport system substrate-binding protein
MKNFKKRYALIPLILAATMISACGNKSENVSQENIDLSNYPINTDVELTYWMELDTNASTTVSNFADTPFAKEWMKKTGVPVRFIHPAQGQQTESFSLLVASNDMPDIVYYTWHRALGGPDTSIRDEVIIELDELIDKYASNLKNYLNQHKDIDKAVKTSDNHYYLFPFIRGDRELLVSSGTIMRQDWLEELGLSVPTTYEEMETVLREFKTKKNANAPLSFVNTNLPYILNYFSATNNFFLEDGKVKYGPMEPEYKNAIEVLKSWYDEGLLDKNYVSVDTKQLDSNILNENTGVTFASGGSGLGKWLQTMEGENSSFELVGIAPLVDPQTGKAKFANVGNYYEGTGAAISASSTHKELAAKFLDYLYSDEGHMLANFGIEGESYTMVDGYPTYTDLIMNNSDGLTVTQAMAQYQMAYSVGPFVQDKRYIEQYYELPEQKNALKAWESKVDEAQSSKLPLLLYTAEENDEYSQIMTEVKKYCDQMTATFISGVTDISEYDSFIKRMEDLGINRAIEITQNAYERYNSRN